MNPDSAGTRGWCRIVLSAALVCAASLGASPVRIHQIDSQAGFVAGTLEGVRVDARGVLTLAADVDSVAQVPEPFAFAVTALADGWAIGTGGEGRVLKVARDGAVSVLFDAPEANVFALLADPDGTLFIGTSPAGKVYRVLPGSGGRSEPFFDPGETYIWALARGADGALWVATGTEGHLYRVDALGQGRARLRRRRPASAQPARRARRRSADRHGGAGSAPSPLARRRRTHALRLDAVGGRGDRRGAGWNGLRGRAGVGGEPRRSRGLRGRPPRRRRPATPAPNRRRR